MVVEAKERKFSCDVSVLFIYYSKYQKMHHLWVTVWKKMLCTIIYNKYSHYRSTEKPIKVLVLSNGINDRIIQY